YYDKIQGRHHNFDTMVKLVRTHFENNETRQLYLSEWRETTFQRVINDNPTKSRSECLQLLFDGLQKIQRGLPDQSENALRDQIISACRGIPECNLALFQPGNTFEAVCSQLRSAVGTAIRTQEARQMQQFPTAQDEDDETWWTDRTYRGRGNYQNRGRGF